MQPSPLTEGAHSPQIDQVDHESGRGNIESSRFGTPKLPNLKQSVQYAPEEQRLHEIWVARYWSNRHAEGFKDRLPRGKADHTTNQIEQFQCIECVARSREVLRRLITHD